MKIKIRKRDSRLVDFDKNRIIDAVLAAFKEVDGEITDYALEKSGNIADYIQDIAENKDEPLTVEEVQDYVEKGLSSTKRKDVAKAFILYRYERTKERNRKSDLMKAISKHINAQDIQNSNANMDEASFGGRKGEAANALMKQYALDYCMSELARNNHLNNTIYTHDLDSYSVGQHNCLSIPFDDLLKNGFNTRQVDIRPANSINTAFQLVAVIFQLQSLQQFGGTSATHLDWTMVPYVRKSFKKHFKEGIYYLEENSDKATELFTKDDLSIEAPEYKTFKNAYKYAMDMTLKELNQAVEGLYHNLNSLQSRSGNQLPFTSINLGTCTLPEGRLVIKAMLEGCINGVGKHHRTSIFPCLIFQCMKGVNRKAGEPNYDMFQLALKSTAKRLYPNYANCDWSGNAGYDINDPRTYFSTMGLVA